MLLDERASFESDLGRCVPAHIRGGIVRYVNDGTPVGSFLSAVLCNDLKTACLTADPDNRRALAWIVGWLYEHAPGLCWGSEERMRAWIAHKGINGSDSIEEGLRQAIAIAQEIELQQERELGHVNTSGAHAVVEAIEARLRK